MRMVLGVRSERRRSAPSVQSCMASAPPPAERTISLNGLHSSCTYTIFCRNAQRQQTLLVRLASVFAAASCNEVFPRQNLCPPMPSSEDFIHALEGGHVLTSDSAARNARSLSPPDNRNRRTYWLTVSGLPICSRAASQPFELGALQWGQAAGQAVSC